MSDAFYSVDQVAERLGLHVRTVRNYVRDGRLAAVRIGKQYRIAHADLEAFTGRPAPTTPSEAADRRRVDVSSVATVEPVDRATADRLSTLLTSAVSGPPGAQPVRIETAYDQERSTMKIIILGGPGDTARLLESIEGVLST